MHSFARQVLRHARQAILLGSILFFALGTALGGELPLAGRLRILCLTLVGPLCMAGWVYVQDEIRLYAARVASRKRFGLELPQPVHLGMEAILSAGVLASLVALALFTLLSACGARLLVAYGVGAVAAMVFVRWFLHAQLANLWQDLRAATDAESVRLKEQKEASLRRHLTATEATLARLLETIGEEPNSKLEAVYLAKHRIDPHRNLVASHEPVDLTPETLQACDELIRLVMSEASRDLSSAPIFRVFEKFPQIPRRIYGDAHDAYADLNRY